MELATIYESLIESQIVSHFLVTNYLLSSVYKIIKKNRKLLGCGNTSKKLISSLLWFVTPHT